MDTRAQIEPSGSICAPDATGPEPANRPISVSSPGSWRGQLRRVLDRRYLVIAVAMAGAAVVAGGHGDWDVFVAGGQQMSGRDGLSFFIRHGDIQTGPLTLLVARFGAWLPDNGFPLAVVICALLGIAAIRSVDRVGSACRPTDADGHSLRILVGGIVLAFWWAKLGGYGHLDDAVVLTVAASAVERCRSNRRVSAALLLGIAIAFKPWAVILLPLTISPDGSLRRRLRSPALGLAVAALPWSPFVFAHPATLHSLRTTVKVASDSVIRLVGMSDANLPSWIRLAQLGVACVVATVAVLRGRPSGAVAVAIAIRLAFDPGTWSYYTAGLVLGALIWDVCQSEALLPVATLACTALLAPAWIVHSAELRSWLRLAACVGVIAVVLVHDPRRRHPIPGRRHGFIPR